jgi:hypothetical protein
MLDFHRSPGAAMTSKLCRYTLAHICVLGCIRAGKTLHGRMMFAAAAFSYLVAGPVSGLVTW